MDRQARVVYVADGSLSDPQTYARIAVDAGIDPEHTKQLLASGEAARLAQGDFAQARGLGVSTYPTLLVVDGDRIQRLSTTGTALQALDRELDAALRLARGRR